MEPREEGVPQLPQGKRAASARTSRDAPVRRALQLEYLTVGWNVIEGVIAVMAARAAGSVALLGFGIDSFVECLSGSILIWRLLQERRGLPYEKVEALDLRAHRLVGLSLFALAGYIALDAGWSFWRQERPASSLVGLGLTVLSLLVMMWLARAKRRAARALGSRALEADAFQTTACWWLSLITLVGVALNTAIGWWWADPVAAFVMVPLLVREGREAWRGEDCD